MQGAIESESRSVEPERQVKGVEFKRTPSRQRTLVIVLSQVVVLIAILVVWSILRSRRGTPGQSAVCGCVDSGIGPQDCGRT